jgi:hypothetical protein
MMDGSWGSEYTTLIAPPAIKTRNPQTTLGSELESEI